MRIVSESLEEAQHAFVEHRMHTNRIIEIGELCRRWQFAVQQEVRNLDKTGMRRELFYRVAPVHQDTFFTINEGDIRLAASGRYKARVVGKSALLFVETGDVDHVRSNSTLPDG